MNYIEILQTIHQQLQPKNYVEIGCRAGKSLSLAKCPSLAIDPDFEISMQLEYPTRLFKATSDYFFQQFDIKQLLGDRIDFAFIDGMHWVEYALRDFINIEKNSHPSTVVLIDDVLPEKIEWTFRERITDYWTGDIYQIIPILKKYRPDLKIQVLDVKIKGLALVTGVNPDSKTLSQNYTTIEKDIFSNVYKINSVEKIREIMDPIPIQELENLLEKIKEQRISVSDAT